VRLDPDDFEALYQAQLDPWEFASSAYEQAKYARTIAALDDFHAARGLELGCSIGVLTERLAEHCDELVAIDASPTAIARARERVEGVDLHVAVIPEQLPDGPFDLIVASEILYYFDAPALAELLDELEERLEPGGLLLAVHWRPPTRTYPLRGDAVHTLLRDRPALTQLHSETHDQYVLDLLERA
jgi:SAM-dependent methyltransferase